MRLTAPFAVSDKSVEKDGVLDWINREAALLLRQLRTFANFLGVDRQTGVTAGDGAFTAIWTSPVMPTNGVWGLRANITGVSTSGAAQGAYHETAACVQSTAGTLALIGVSSVILVFESAAAINTRFVIDGTARTVSLEVRDDAVSPMRWTAVIQVNEALTA